MTDLLDRLRKLREGATKGPWFLWHEEDAGYKPTLVNQAAHDGIGEGYRYILDLRGPGREYKAPSAETAANAALVLALVNALPQIEAALALAEAAVSLPENTKIRLHSGPPDALDGLDGQMAFFKALAHYRSVAAKRAEGSA